MFEGLFGVILSIIASIGKEPFKYILIHKFFYTTGQLILLICLLFFYLILSITTNAYKVYSNIIFSPMDASLINYMLNPAFNIYFFIYKLDFNNNYYSFIISEIICLVITFFGCIYNEYIIISWCGLNEETDDAIRERTISKINIPLILGDDLHDNSEQQNSLISIDNDND